MPNTFLSLEMQSVCNRFSVVIKAMDEKKIATRFYQTPMPKILAHAFKCIIEQACCFERRSLLHSS
jgi:hypothetical protein